jgi:lipopolysaccharide/colanic/teichoic acid biosynthesis glycosyltransferase
MVTYQGKRFLDCFIIGICSPFLGVLLVGCALYVRILIGRPVFFRQERAGLHGKPFTLLKFRTMTDARDASGTLLQDDVRLTAAGRFLRSTSLDELPEVLNILRGEMSLVGPRPLPVSYVELYSPAQAERLKCLPGLTGLAQVRGRNAIAWEKRFSLDREYVSRMSFFVDIQLLLSTVFAVVSRRGISAEGSATMEAFTGSNEEHSDVLTKPDDSVPARKNES